jgi:trimeric autotransporter adhesin
MTGDLRERLRDLAGEMAPLHAPRNLEARVRRREVGVIAAGVVGVVATVVIAVAGFRTLDRSEPVVPANPVPFPVAEAGAPATSVLLEAPEGLMVDPSGNVFLSEWYGNKIDVVPPDGSLVTIAGKGPPGYSGDGRALDENIDSPTAMALADDSLLFVDNGNSCIRRIDTQGMMTTVAGRCGFEGYSGDGGPATDARLSRPLGLVLDGHGDGGYYFSDNDHGLVRHVTGTGIISTVAGAGDVSPLDIGPAGVKASSLNLGRTSYVLLDPDGNLYVTDLRLNIIVKIDPLGTATVVAGTGQRGYSGDGGPATQAELNFPAGLAMDPHGNLYVADSHNNVVREIGKDGIITTVAGDGVEGNSLGGGVATRAHLSAPSGLAFGNGALYIADQGNDLVRQVDHGKITTFAGK